MDELDAQIAGWTSTHTLSEVLELLAEHGVPAGEIFTAENMLHDPHYRARQMVVRMPNRDGVDIPMTGVVPKFSRTPASINSVGPWLGQDTASVLRDLAGIDEAQLVSLVSDGIVGVADEVGAA